MKKDRKTTQARKPKPSKRIPRAKNGTEDDFELTRAQLRELRRRVADMKDPVRYLIEGGFGPRFRLYYNVTDDVYTWRDPRHATLFKRRKAALAIQRLLRGGTRIVRCTTQRRKGQLIPILPSRKRDK